MDQPQFTRAQVQAMTTQELARRLEEWAQARQIVSAKRELHNKAGLDSHLLLGAAERLLWLHRRLQWQHEENTKMWHALNPERTGG